jgi:hypothetical protein
MVIIVLAELQTGKWSIVRVAGDCLFHDFSTEEEECDGREAIQMIRR